MLSLTQDEKTENKSPRIELESVNSRAHIGDAASVQDARF